MSQPSCHTDPAERQLIREEIEGTTEVEVPGED